MLLRGAKALSEYLKSQGVGLHRNTIYKCTREKSIPHFKVGQIYIYDTEKIDLWLRGEWKGESNGSDTGEFEVNKQIHKTGLRVVK